MQPLEVLVGSDFSDLFGLFLEQLEQIKRVIGIPHEIIGLRQSAHSEIAGKEATAEGAGRKGQTHENLVGFGGCSFAGYATGYVWGWGCNQYQINNQANNRINSNE